MVACSVGFWVVCGEWFVVPVVFGLFVHGESAPPAWLAFGHACDEDSAGFLVSFVVSACVGVHLVVVVGFDGAV